MSSRIIKFVSGFFLILFIGACTAPEISDYTNRSVVYSWFDLDDAVGNKIVGGSFLTPDLGTYPIGYFEFAGGYVVYHSGVKPGPIKIRSISTMTCFGLCGNVVNVFDFGSQGGEIASAVIRGQGAYYLGSYKIDSPRTGLFGPRNFSVVPANGPSRRQILEAIYLQAPEAQKPVIQAAISQL